MSAIYHEIVNQMPEQDLRQAAKDILQMKDTRFLPEGPVKNLQLEIAKVLGHSQSLPLAINMVKEEILKRFANSKN